MSIDLIQVFVSQCIDLIAGNVGDGVDDPDDILLDLCEVGTTLLVTLDWDICRHWEMTSDLTCQIVLMLRQVLKERTDTDSNAFMLSGTLLLQTGHEEFYFIFHPV